MNERFCIAYFDDETDLRSAIEEARQRGLPVLDAFCPHPTHLLPEAIGLRPSRLTWIGFWAGIIGLVLGFTLQFWTSVYDWPLIIGGQPFASWPVWIPVSFELTVLFAGVLGVLAFLFRERLWPGNLAPILRGVTNDQFAVVIRVPDASIAPEEVIELMRRHGASQVIEGDEVG